MTYFSKGFAFSALAITGVLTGCAAMPDALRVMFGPSVDFIQPPEHAALKQYTAVYVTSDQKSAAMIEPSAAMLTNARVGISPLFAEVSQSAPSKQSMAEQQWAQLRFANLSYKEDRQSSVENRVQCNDNKLFCKDKDVVRRYQVRCNEYEVILSTQVQVTDLRKKTELGKLDASSSKSDKHCSDDSGSPKSFDDLKTEAFKELMAKSTGRLLPSKKARPLELLDKDSKASADINQSLKDAFDKSKGGKLDFSEQVYLSLEANGVQSFAVFFNLGLINQMKGRFEPAKTYYSKAKAFETAENAEILTKYTQEVDSLLAAGQKVAWGSN